MHIDIVKSNKDEQIYIIKSYRKNGKSTSKIYKKLGSMDDLLKDHHQNREEVIAWAKKQAKFYTDYEVKKIQDIQIKPSQTKLIQKNVNSTFNGGYLFLQCLYYQLGLDKICQHIEKKYHLDYHLSDILSFLIYSRTLFPTFDDIHFEESHFFIEFTHLDSQNILSAINVLYQEKNNILSSLYKNMSDFLTRNTQTLFYDYFRYSFMFESNNEQCKENDIIQMGLLMNEQSIPITFHFDSEHSYTKSLSSYDKKIYTDFKKAHLVICTDNQLSHIKNLNDYPIQKKSYVITLSPKMFPKDLKAWSLDSDGWYLEDGTSCNNLSNVRGNNMQSVFYKEKRMNEKEKYIVIYSLQYKKAQEELRRNVIEQSLKMIKGRETIVRQITEKPQYLQMENFILDGKIMKTKMITLNDETIKEEAKYDGFCGVYTTLDYDTSIIVKMIKRRWDIEYLLQYIPYHSFNITDHLTKQEKLNLHFLIGYLSLLLYMILYNQLQQKYDFKEIIKNLAEMKFHYIDDVGYIPIYTRTDFTDDLHEVFQLRTDTEIITKQTMQDIIKFTKQHKINCISLD